VGHPQAPPPPPPTVNIVVQNITVNYNYTMSFNGGNTNSTDQPVSAASGHVIGVDANTEGFPSELLRYSIAMYLSCT
jgi:hypothetical protein